MSSEPQRPAVSPSPFVIHIRPLRRAPGLRWHRSFRSVLDDLRVTGSAVPDGEAVEVDVDLEAAQGGVAVSGEVRFEWSGRCRRCLEAVTGASTVGVRELFTIDGDGEETYRLEKDVLDLAPLVRDAVVLELPAAPLCSADCLGLCPSCGADRNRQACDCAPVPDGRWAALDALRAPLSAEGAPSGYPPLGPTTR